jgi:competence protein ComEA
MNRRELIVAALLVGALAAGAGLATLRRARILRLASACPVSVGHAAVESAGATLALPLDLNSATAQQLEVLPGIGPVIAQRIVAFREQVGGFGSVRQLRDVGGIGPKRYAALQGLVIVTPR